MAYDCDHTPQCVNQRHHTSRFYTERARADEEPRQPTLGEYVWTVITAVCAAALVVIVVLLATSCTPAQQQTLGSLASNPTTVTTLKIAACIQGAVAEEEQERLRQRREAERLAAEEAEAIADAAREHPGSVKDEVEKVLKDGAK